MVIVHLHLIAIFGLFLRIGIEASQYDYVLQNT